jgi:hypothetical protein
MNSTIKYLVLSLLLTILQSICVYSARQFDDVQLNNLTTSTGILIKGNHPHDLAGGAMTSIGDINGDGIDDFAVTASV